MREISFWSASTFAGLEGAVDFVFCTDHDGPLICALPASPTIPPNPAAPARPVLAPGSTDFPADPCKTAAIAANPAAPAGSHLRLELVSGALQLYAHNTSPLAPPLHLDMEDTTDLRDGYPHRVQVSFHRGGTAIFLDGYQVFSSATNAHPSQLGKSGSIYADQSVASCTFSANRVDPQQAALQWPAPPPDVVFAAAQLSAPDVRAIKEWNTGTIWLQFRVRGPGQYGTILGAQASETNNAREHSRETLRLSIDSTGIHYQLLVAGSWHRVLAPGSWDDGAWHDLTVRASAGAVDIYVDGFLHAHEPGQFFFAATDIGSVSVGADYAGVRLMGEVRRGGIYRRALNDSHIKTLSRVVPAQTQCLFDKGFAGARSYRIPTLLTTDSGVVIAGADQRVDNSNDAPNRINFVIRRSLDGGTSWEPLQKVVGFPGAGEDGSALGKSTAVSGAAATDACLVYDRQRGRIIALLDYFPAGVGLPNARPGVGTDEDGNLLLADGAGTFTLRPDGRVVAEGGGDTGLVVDEDGWIWRGEHQLRNIHFPPLSPGDTGNGSLPNLRPLPMSYLMQVHSDDDGQTWSQPVFIDRQVKAPWMPFLGICPGRGIQLQRAPYAGRLLAPYYFTSETGRHYSSGVLISDDGGRSWRRGGSVNDGRVFDGEPIDPRTLHVDAASASETTVVELGDGSVRAFFRNQHPSGRVGTCISEDGGETWGPISYLEQVPEIFSQPNAISWPATADEPSQRVAFVNASRMLPYRGCGVVRISDDGGQTWPTSRCVNPYHFVYQCLTVLPDGRLGLLWERETAGVYFTALPREWFDSKH